MKLDNATIEAMQTLLNESRTETGIVVDVDDPVINLLLEALANRAQYLNEIGLEYLISRLKQLYVERLPDKGLSTNDFTDELLEKLMNTASKGDLQEVKNELVEIINGITSFEYMVVSELPSKGKKGTIYLLRLSKFNTVKNLYEEYIWVQDRYELLGMLDTDQEGPFVTADDFKEKLKDYIQKIKIGTSEIGPGTTGVADISDAIMALVKAQVGTIGSVNKINLNGTDYSPTNGTVSLPTLAHQVKVNGTSYTANASGLVTIQDLVHRIKINGTWKTVGTTGDIDLGSFATSGDIPDAPDLSGYVKSIKANSTTAKTPNTSGQITFDYLVYQVKINGSTKSPNTSGVVDLGTISGGNTVYTGTTEPSSSLGSNDDFYYKFPS